MKVKEWLAAGAESRSKWEGWQTFSTLPESSSTRRSLWVSTQLKGSCRAGKGLTPWSRWVWTQHVKSYWAGRSSTQRSLSVLSTSMRSRDSEDLSNRSTAPGFYLYPKIRIALNLVKVIFLTMTTMSRCRCGETPGPGHCQGCVCSHASGRIWSHTSHSSIKKVCHNLIFFKEQKENNAEVAMKWPDF